MNQEVFNSLSKRGFKNYTIETVSPTVVVVYDNSGSNAKVTLDFDNFFITVDQAKYGTFKYLLKIAAIVINTIGNGEYDAYDWRIK